MTIIIEENNLLMLGLEVKINVNTMNHSLDVSIPTDLNNHSESEPDLSQ